MNKVRWYVTDITLQCIWLYWCSDIHIELDHNGCQWQHFIPCSCVVSNIPMCIQFWISIYFTCFNCSSSAVLIFLYFSILSASYPLSFLFESTVYDSIQGLFKSIVRQEGEEMWVVWVHLRDEHCAHLSSFAYLFSIGSYPQPCFTISPDNCCQGNLIICEFESCERVSLFCIHFNRVHSKCGLLFCRRWTDWWSQHHQGENWYFFFVLHPSLVWWHADNVPRPCRQMKRLSCCRGDTWTWLRSTGGGTCWRTMHWRYSFSTEWHCFWRSTTYQSVETC